MSGRGEAVAAGGGKAGAPAPSYARAIHRITEVAARAHIPEPIYQAAIGALIDTLGADRAAVLLADPAGVMRFTAWRGLSDGYRAVAEGHSPWPPGATDAEPVLVPDVEAEPSLHALRPAILSEGVRALGFIPLISGGRLLGKFMVYFDRPRALLPDEVEVAQAIAAQVAFAIDKRRLETELREANAALASVLAAVPDGITVQAPDGDLLFANTAAADMIGYGSPEELVVAGPGAIVERFEVLDEDGAPLDLRDLPGRQALLGLEPPDRLVRYGTSGRDDERWSTVSARPVFSDTGDVRFAVNVFRDVTEHHQTLQALHESERRVAFLARSSRQLIDTALDYATILDRVAELFVPELADVVAVRELAPDGSLRRATVQNSDAVDPDGLEELAGSLAERLLQHRPVLVADAGPAYPALLAGRGLRSAIVAPLLARGRALGVVTLLAVDRCYTEADVALVDEVARRAGLAVENARLFEEQSTVASVLQRALLPPALPSIPGFELAARYHAAASEIGGDFYDVVPVADGRWMIAVGDVCGKGIEAASFTAMVRYTLRAFAPAAASPSALLALVNGALVRQLAAERFCTVACAFLDTTAPAPRFTVALGGHPQPLLVSPDGSVRAIGTPGTLLGTLAEPDLADDEVVLGPGEAVVVFTDGCLGALPSGQDEDRLVTAVRRRAGTGAASLAEAVELAAHTEVGHTDDLTVLACVRLA